MCRDALTGCRSSSDTVLANHNILRRCPHCAAIEVRVGVGFVFFRFCSFRWRRYRTQSMHPAYFETRFRCEASLGELPSHFVILSAYATTGEVWSDEQNAAADQRLFRELQASSPTFLKRVIGYSPSTHHAEPSWAVEIPIFEAQRIGNEFAQDALYYIDHGALWVASCRATVAPVYVDRFESRLDPCCR